MRIAEFHPRIRSIHSKRFSRFSIQNVEPEDRSKVQATRDTDMPVAAIGFFAWLAIAVAYLLRVVKRNCEGVTNMKLAELHWPEVEKLDREKIVAVIPVGSMEQHGPHLPFQVDVFCLIASGRRSREENLGRPPGAADLGRCFRASHELPGLYHVARQSLHRRFI